MASDRCKMGIGLHPLSILCLCYFSAVYSLSLSVNAILRRWSSFHCYSVSTGCRFCFHSFRYFTLWLTTFLSRLRTFFPLFLALRWFFSHTNLTDRQLIARSHSESFVRRCVFSRCSLVIGRRSPRIESSSHWRGMNFYKPVP